MLPCRLKTRNKIYALIKYTQNANIRIQIFIPLYFWIIFILIWPTKFCKWLPNRQLLLKAFVTLWHFMTLVKHALLNIDKDLKLAILRSLTLISDYLDNFSCKSIKLSWGEKVLVHISISLLKFYQKKGYYINKYVRHFQVGKRSL